jgi:hypothetical protein
MIFIVIFWKMAIKKPPARVADLSLLVVGSHPESI